MMVFPAKAFTATAKYSGGSGTAQDLCQIATAADLIALGETPEDYDKHFLPTADIDLDPNLPGRKVFARAVIAPGGEPHLPRTRPVVAAVRAATPAPNGEGA